MSSEFEQAKFGHEIPHYDVGILCSTRKPSASLIKGKACDGGTVAVEADDDRGYLRVPQPDTPILMARLGAVLAFQV